jgi:hypothetical protein
MTQPRGGPLAGELTPPVLPVEHLAREDESLYDIRLHRTPPPVLLYEPIGIPVTTEYLYSLGVRHGCRASSSSIVNGLYQCIISIKPPFIVSLLPSCQRRDNVF